MINAVQLIAHWTHQTGLTLKKAKVAPLHPPLLTAQGKMLHQKVMGLKRPPPLQLLPHIPGNHGCRSVPQFLPPSPQPPVPTRFIMYQPKYCRKRRVWGLREEGFGLFQGILDERLLGTAAYIALINTRRAFHANTLNTKCFSSISRGFMTIMII